MSESISSVTFDMRFRPFSVSKKATLLSFSVIALFGFGSCAPQPSVYLPTSPQVPLLSKEGEFHLSLASNVGYNPTDEQDDYYSLETAYALTPDIGLIGTIAYNPFNLDSNNVGYLYGEVGTGYYKKFGDFGRFEAYSGLGFGHLHSRLLQSENGYVQYSLGPSSDFVQKDVNFLRPFVQMSLGAEGSVAAIAFSMRLSYLSLSRLQSDSASWTYNTINSVRQLTTYSDSGYRLRYSDLFFEPAIVFRIGYDPIKLEFRFWWSEPFKGTAPFLWAETNSSLSLSFDLKP